MAGRERCVAPGGEGTTGALFPGGAAFQFELKKPGSESEDRRACG
jgi:hypothetical protein